MNGKEDNGLQLFTTLLAYSLPILQFFFSQLSSSIQFLFLFKSYFLIVSVFTAILSYVMILVLKSTPWFSVSILQFRRKKQFRDWYTFTNSSVYTTDEIKAYQSKHKQPPPLRSIKPDNVTQYVLLPLLFFSFVIFLTLGVQYGSSQGFKIHNHGDVAKLIGQIISYTLFLVSSVLSFAHQYIRDSGRRKFQQQKNNKFEKAIQLARQRDAFREQKKVSLIIQKDVNLGNPNSEITFLVQVDEKYCIILTDSNVDTIIYVKEFDDLSQAENIVVGAAPSNPQNQPTENENEQN